MEQARVVEDAVTKDEELKGPTWEGQDGLFCQDHDLSVITWDD